MVAQNLHLRVQIFPIIMKVAVPLPQHSARLGHLPSTQMVCKLFFAIISLMSRYFLPCGSDILSQSGLRCIFVILINVLNDDKIKINFYSFTLIGVKSLQNISSNEI